MSEEKGREVFYSHKATVKDIRIGAYNGAPYIEADVEYEIVYVYGARVHRRYSPQQEAPDSQSEAS